MAVEFPEHPFWDFSLKVYGREGVPGACLVLQERHEMDINVLLFCCWLGASGRGVIDADEIARAVEAVDPWHQTVVRQLRAVRQRMKGGMPPAPQTLSDPLRSRIAKAEVDCEHVEQLMLAASIVRPAEDGLLPDRRASDASENIATYLRLLGADFSADDRPSLVVILGAVFTEADSEMLDTLCGGLEAA